MRSDSRGNPARPIPLTGVVALIVVQNIAFAVAGLVLWHWSGRSIRDLVEISGPTLAGGVLLGGVLAVVAWWGFRWFPRLAERLVELQADTYRILGRDLSWAAIVAISLAAGIGEEVLLRGGLQTLFNDQFGALAAILLASAVFAVIHLAQPLVTALLFVIGVLFGTIYWLTGSLLVVVIGHALYDVWALRYLHSEFVRLGVFDRFEEPEAPLAKPVNES